jgi:hypothetical protein
MESAERTLKTAVSKGETVPHDRYAVCAVADGNHVDRMFGVFVQDLGEYAVAVHGQASATREQQAGAMALIRRAVVDPAAAAMPRSRGRAPCAASGRGGGPSRRAATPAPSTSPGKSRGGYGNGVVLSALSRPGLPWNGGPASRGIAARHDVESATTRAKAATRCTRRVEPIFRAASRMTSEAPANGETCALTAALGRRRPRFRREHQHRTARVALLSRFLHCLQVAQVATSLNRSSGSP